MRLTSINLDITVFAKMNTNMKIENHSEHSGMKESKDRRTYPSLNNHVLIEWGNKLQII